MSSFSVLSSSFTGGGKSAATHAILEKLIGDEPNKSIAVRIAEGLPTLQECIHKASASLVISGDTLKIEHGSSEEICCGKLQSCPLCTALYRVLRLDPELTESLYGKNSLVFRIAPERKTIACLQGWQNDSIASVEVDLETEYISG
jgi:hypothetical protein